MGRSRRADPDYVLDADRGSSASPSTKRAALLGQDEAKDRAETRDGARGLDQAVEAMPGLSRQQRDRERAMPRDVAGEVPDPRMERRLPGAEEVRRPLSSRQAKARSVTKRAVQDRLPQTQHAAVAGLIGQPERWAVVNDALSEAAGDVQDVDEAQRVQIQRVDRAIQAYEQASSRGHVVYCNVRMPAMINSSNLGGYLRNQFTVGTVVDFDRFTGGAHALHQVEAGRDVAHRTAAFEIQTRRGMYLGRSDRVDDTAHLLPRGLRLAVAGVQHVTYQRPDGSTGRRQVVQLLDITG